MRKSLSISLIAVALAGCASSPGGGAAAGAEPAQAAATGGPNPCAAGGCRITIQLEQEIIPLLEESNLNFRLYRGCPRTLGGETAAAIRNAPTLIQQASPTIILPAFEGRSVALAYYFGPNPGPLTVVDFSVGREQTIKAPYIQGGTGYTTDPQITNENRTLVRRCVA